MKLSIKTGKVMGRQFEIDNDGDLVWKQGRRSVQEAYKVALTSGSKLVMRIGDDLVETQPGKPVRVLEKLPPRSPAKHGVRAIKGFNIR